MQKSHSTQKTCQDFQSSEEGKNTQLAEQVVSLLGLLGFDDCVFYLYQESQNCLIQTAAHGTKNPNGTGIIDPVKLSVGEGVVGYVAQHLSITIINEANFDKRYIADNQFRPSELAVPVFSDNQFIGVLDSEHETPYHYNQHHIEMIKTVLAKLNLHIEKETNPLKNKPLKNKPCNIAAKPLKTFIHGERSFSAQDSNQHAFIVQCLKHYTDSSAITRLLHSCPFPQHKKLNVHEIRHMIESIAEQYKSNPKNQKYHQILYHTYFFPLPNQLAVAEKLHMGYSTYRRHLKKVQQMILADFIELNNNKQLGAKQRFNDKNHPILSIIQK